LTAIKLFFWQKNSAIWSTPFVLGAYIENYVMKGALVQKGAAGIIFGITGIILAKNGDFA
jgi:hypothetical protein